MKAEVIFDDSWDEDAIVNAFTDNDQFPGVISVRVVPSHCGKCAAETVEQNGQNAQQSQSDEYKESLSEIERWINDKNMASSPTMQVEQVRTILQRLKLGKAASTEREEKTWFNGCGNDGCLCVKPQGMATNGLCKCHEIHPRKAISFLWNEIRRLKSPASTERSERIVLGVDCCGQEIVPVRGKLQMYTNRHTNCDGTLWGWIEGCDKNICWSDNKIFGAEQARVLVKNWNTRAASTEREIV